MRKLVLITAWILWTAGACIAQAPAAGRQHIPLNEGWTFYFAYDSRQNAPVEKVILPHTWNAGAVAAGKADYNRTAGIYQRTIKADPAWKGKRVFLYFEGASSVADVLINKQFIASHKGGYTAFCVELTAFLRQGAENLLTVQVSNASRQDVLPLSGDFNVYGGIHRPVSLIVTERNCITPLDHASPGVYLRQQQVSSESAAVNVLTKLSITEWKKGMSIRTVIRDAARKEVARMQVSLQSALDVMVEQAFTLLRPHLWNGRKDPYLYTATVQLMEGDKVADEISQPLGLRYYRVDADSGFVLNGAHMDLYGFGRHEDVAGKGSALSAQDQEKDMSLIMEAGATAMRLTHYPHSPYFYDLADRNGIVLWTEIPLVGPGGYTGTGYIGSPELQQFSRQVLTELIRQQYNHPSICFWGLFNELKLDYDNPVPFLSELNALAKKEDPFRLTTCASFLDNNTFNSSSDLIAWNKYFGWYGGNFSDMGSWADKMHRQFPGKPIAISEYGAGANVLQHVETLKAPDPGGAFHPEEWQTAYHEHNWEMLRQRPFLWGKFVWVLNDFGSAIRDEGGVKGLNDKGLVTYDRRIKKDAFYFYKANWSSEATLYIAERRNDVRNNGTATVRVFTNLDEPELFVNGRSAGKARRDSLNRAVWENVALQPDKNLVTVQAMKNGKQYADSCIWMRNSDTANKLQR